MRLFMNIHGGRARAVAGAWCALASVGLLPASELPAWNRILGQPAEWYGTADARAVAESVILYQTPHGGWPKNTDMTRPPTEGHAPGATENELAATIDNGATTTQIELLARIASAQEMPAARQSVTRGIEYLLEAQYPNGGWPQFFPLRRGYYSHVTYNDGAMTHVLELLQAVARSEPPYAWLPSAAQERAARAVDRGVACILRSQVRVDGRLTAWCAQHDANTLAPAAARAYELVSLSGSESVGILRFLMSLPNPTAEVVAAVEAGVSWLDQVKLTGWRLERVRVTEGGRQPDQFIVADPAAPPLWARFYEIGSNRPIFTGRDGVAHDTLDKVELERRTGYSYYGTWPATLLSREYPAWRARAVALAPR